MNQSRHTHTQYQIIDVIALIRNPHTNQTHQFVQQNTSTETHPDLAGISAPFLIASTEHTGGDLVVIVIRSVTDSVADDGDVRFLENIC